MRKFLNNLLIFSLLVPVLYYTKPLFMLHNDRYKFKVCSKGVYAAIEKSKKQFHSRILILGDSVAAQIFPISEFSSEICSLTTNQAISMAGQYALLSNFVAAGNKPELIILFFIPNTFQNNLDQIYTYNYFIKPFYQEEFLHLFNASVHKQIERIPFYYLAREPSILTSDWSPNITENREKNTMFFSKLSIEYLAKIKKLADNYRAKIIILSPPVCENSIAIGQFASQLTKTVENNDFTKEFSHYLKDMEVFTGSYFLDGVHLKEKTLIRKKYSEKIWNFQKTPK